MRLKFARLMVTVYALALCAIPAFTQSAVTGNITGRAQDSSGALIPGVEYS